MTTCKTLELPLQETIDAYERREAAPDFQDQRDENSNP